MLPGISLDTVSSVPRILQNLVTKLSRIFLEVIWKLPRKRSKVMRACGSSYEIPVHPLWACLGGWGSGANELCR